MAIPITFPSPGFAGLNKQREQALLSPEWATEAQNAVIDEAGRIAARKGWLKLTSSAIISNPNIEAIHEYEKTDGSVSLIAAANNKVYESTDDGATWTNKTGALTITANGWQFANFNGKVIGVQAGHARIEYNGSGNFALSVAASGTLPTNPIAILSAFGRIWLLGSDKQTIGYSALLDDTRYDPLDGAGNIDMTSVWTNGTDEGVSLAAFGSSFIVLGKRHVIIWVDGQGSSIGIDPENMYVTDTIEGVGTVARDSVKNIGEGDLFFLSTNGIRSLQRVLQDRQTPINDVSQNSRSYITTLLLAPDVDQSKVRSTYSPEEGFYLLVSPDVNEVICIDVKIPNQPRITEWPGLSPTSLLRRKNGDVVFGFNGIIGKYYGYLDNLSPYRFVFRSGWLDLQEQNETLKMFKRAKLLAYSPGGVTVTVKWFYDFKRYVNYAQVTYQGDALDEYGTGEYGIAEYSGGLAQRINYFPMSGSGQYILLGVETEINGLPFAVQSITGYYSTGRFA